MPNQPPFIQSPEDSNSENFRLDCLAWWLFTTKPPEELAEYLKRQKALQTESFNNRLQRCRAWWMLKNLNRGQIEADIMAMDRPAEKAMREHLNTVLLEMKAIKRATA